MGNASKGNGAGNGQGKGWVLANWTKISTMDLTTGLTRISVDSLSPKLSCGYGLRLKAFGEYLRLIAT